MNPLGYRIKADGRRRNDTIDCDDVPPNLQIAFTLLFVNRGRTLAGALEDAEGFEIESKDMLDRIHQLMKLGVVELNGDEIFLPLKPRTILDRLGDIRTQRSRSSGDRAPAV